MAASPSSVGDMATPQPNIVEFTGVVADSDFSKQLVADSTQEEPMIKPIVASKHVDVATPKDPVASVVDTNEELVDSTPNPSSISIGEKAIEPSSPSEKIHHHEAVTETSEKSIDAAPKEPANEAIVKTESASDPTVTLAQLSTASNVVQEDATTIATPGDMFDTTPATQHAQTQLEADDFDDGDSTLGTSIHSATMSISSSIFQSRKENGRTYHAYKEGKYLGPNDEAEQDRLDMTHHIHLIVNNGKLTLGPIDPKKPIHRVLDVGTGTGIWAIEYGDEHPESTIFGIDLSPIQPGFVPPNVHFEIDDLEEDWTFGSKFDFIHSRMMVGSFKHWNKFFRQAFENTTPGGYIELCDVMYPFQCDDNSMPKESALREWGHLVVEGCAKTGRRFDVAPTFGTSLEKAGYIDVKLVVTYLPSNTWPMDKRHKEIVFTRSLDWSPEQVEVFLVNVRKEMRDTNIHAYVPLYTWYARKPF